jgi:hypothetical protein
MKTDKEKRLQEIDQELWSMVPYLTAIRIPYDPIPSALVMTRMYTINRRWYDTVRRYHELTKEEEELKHVDSLVGLE